MKEKSWKQKKAEMASLISVECADIERGQLLGSKLASWYVPDDLFGDESICYCFGVGEDISFECELIEEYQCKVFSFDPTPRAIQHVEELIAKTRVGESMATSNDEEATLWSDTRNKHVYRISKDRIHLLQHSNIGVWDKNETMKFFFPQVEEKVSCSLTNIQNTKNYFEAECLTLKSIMQQLGHEELALVKMDIEGAEFCVINSLISDNIKPRVLGLEYHFSDDEPFEKEKERLVKSIQSIIDFGLTPIYQKFFDIVFVRNDYFEKKP